MPAAQLTFTPAGRVLVVDDDAAARTATVQSLELAGLEVVSYESATAAIGLVDGAFNGVIVSDIRMPEIDGLQFFKQVQALDPAIPFILITGHGDVATAVQALRDGADDFLTKPFASAHLVAAVQRGLHRRRLELDNRHLRALAEASSESSPLLGETPAIVRLREAIDQVAEADIDVLIEGETGTGKELVAHLLHRRGRRRAKPFVAVACGALHAAGPRNAHDDIFANQIESVRGGTLFLDEIDVLPLSLQPRVLRLIEDREIVRHGSRSAEFADLRAIVASRSDLQKQVQQGRFREDFFYAINVVRLRIPPLRERRADIPLLFAHFIDEAASKLRRSPPALTDTVRRHLIEHDWPGNVRELRSFAFQAAVDFTATPTDLEEETVPLPERVDRFEASAICAALEQSGGRSGKAIERLGIPRKTFYDKLRRHGIDIASFRRAKE